MRRWLARIAKGILTLNLAFFVRAMRCGLRDALEGLTASYDRMQPFGAPRRWRLMYEHSAIRPMATKYCRGRGIEVGPGCEPYCDPRRTVFLDKFPSVNPSRIRIDIVGDAFEIPARDDSFDYLFSAHCLEHMPDALRVLLEWRRVVKSGGILFLILPHGHRTFDRGRTLSTLEHHLADYANRVGLDDPTHWREFEGITVPQGNPFWLRDPRSRKADGNLDFRWIAERGYLHYHVWTQNEFIDFLKHIGCEVLVVLEEVPDRPDSFLIIARVRKDAAGATTPPT